MKRTLVVALSLLAFMACSRSQKRQRKPVEIETVDVGSTYDSQLSTEADERARPVEDSLGGVLPSDFPAALPVFSPSSIVDFGPGYVEIDSPVPETEVRSSLRSQIERSGWEIDSVGEAATTYTRAGRSVRVILTSIGSGTRIRYEY